MFPSSLIALLPADRQWPDSLDAVAIALFVAATIAVPALGHYFMVIDFRAYLRALKGILVRATYYFPEIPEWARHQTPGCLRALGLRMPCGEADVKVAYRRLAERLHPDRGGDQRKFLMLKQHCDNALAYVREHGPTVRPCREM